MTLASAHAFEFEARQKLPALLKAWTGIPAEIVDTPLTQASDFALQLGPVTFLIEVKGRADIATVSRVAKQFATATENLPSTNLTSCIPLLIVPYMGDGPRARCAEEGISWVDLSGNAHIHIEKPLPIHVTIVGNPNLYARKGRRANAFAPKAARVARFFLLYPGQSFLQREIAQETGLDEGYVSKVVRRLETAELLAREESGRVKPPDYDLLLDAWAEANAHRHEQIEGHIPARSGDQLVRQICKTLDQKGLAYAVTGLAAAWAYTHAAGFRKGSIYLGAIPSQDLLNSLDFRTDSHAPNAVFLFPDDDGVFQGKRRVAGFWCAAPPQVYVDLKQDAERGPEFAKMLRSQYLKWIDTLNELDS